jgi:hypothetical protein
VTLFARRAAPDGQTARNDVAGAPLSLQELRRAGDTNDDADRLSGMTWYSGVQCGRKLQGPDR